MVEGWGGPVGTTALSAPIKEKYVAPESVGVISIISGVSLMGPLPS